MSRNTQIQKVSVVCGHKSPRKPYRKPNKSARMPHTTSFGVPLFKVVPLMHHQPPPFQMPMTLEPKETHETPVAPAKTPVKTEKAAPAPAEVPQSFGRTPKSPMNLPSAPPTQKRTFAEFQGSAAPKAMRALNFSGN